MLYSRLRTFAIFLVCSLPGALIAAPVSLNFMVEEYCEVDHYDFCNPGGGMIGTSLTAPPPAAGDGTLVIRARGDFDGALEAVAILLDGAVFGVLFNNDPSDDPFSGISGDVGNQYASVLEATATVDAALLSTLLADGMVDLAFSTRLADTGLGYNEVGNNRNSYDFLSASLTYDATPAVPLPASALLLMGGLAGLSVLSRRRRQR
ncbi:VPLPA-CTERM sorting domain-containing protein [Pseudooceanicola sp.]|uniref:VPLPA-CTERM sorting domain-containing protein n=1 Tax=Pseudooceanicola sp. TaxID=1914328 RepID=UPI0035C73C72